MSECGADYGIFSEELRILDRNTAQYMIDIQQEQLDSQREQLDSQKEQLEQQNAQLSRKEQELAEQHKKAKEEARETARRLFEGGATLQLVTAAMSNMLTEDEIRAVYETT